MFRLTTEWKSALSLVRLGWRRRRRQNLVEQQYVSSLGVDMPSAASNGPRGRPARAERGVTRRETWGSGRLF